MGVESALFHHSPEQHDDALTPLARPRELERMGGASVRGKTSTLLLQHRYELMVARIRDDSVRLQTGAG